GVLTPRPAPALSRHSDLMRIANSGKALIPDRPWYRGPRMAERRGGGLRRDLRGSRGRDGGTDAAAAGRHGPGGRESARGVVKLVAQGGPGGPAGLVRPVGKAPVPRREQGRRAAAPGARAPSPPLRGAGAEPRS